MYCTSIKLIFVMYLTSVVSAHYKFISPCPRLFQYETKSTEPDTWYGILTMISDYDTFGVYANIYLDRPALQLGNWYGKVQTEDNEKYIVTNLKDQLKAHVPKVIRFFVKYNISEPPPKLVEYHLNAKRVCPESAIIETTTMPLELITSHKIVPKPPQIEEALNKPSGGIIGQAPASTSQEPTLSEDEDFFMGDLFQFFNSPTEKDAVDNICGTVVSRPTQLVTYDEPTNEGEFPWHVALYYSKGVDLTYICGASLISKDFVITAAHCVAKPRSSTPVNPKNLSAYLGKHYLKRFVSQGIQDKQISEIIIHPQYNGLNFSNNIALLKFTSPAEYSNFVRPICLWQDSTDLNSIVNKNGKIVGWGIDVTGNVTDQLMQTAMPIVSQKTCLSSHPEFFSRFTSVYTFCAGYRNGTSVCNGDSGGGMIFPTSKENPVWQLRGLVSVSAAARNTVKCDPMNYVVFTDTAKYLDWIKNKIK